MISRGGRRELIQLDVDGSGPLPAFPVTCVLTPEGQVRGQGARRGVRGGRSARCRCGRVMRPAQVFEWMSSGGQTVIFSSLGSSGFYSGT